MAPISPLSCSAKQRRRHESCSRQVSGFALARCCFSLMPALLAPIGFCIAEMTRERGRVMAILFGLFPLSIFYFGEVLGARALRATNNPWTAWTPALLLVLFGLPLCWRQLRR